MHFKVAKIAIYRFGNLPITSPEGKKKLPESGSFSQHYEKY